MSYVGANLVFALNPHFSHSTNISDISQRVEPSQQSPLRYFSLTHKDSWPILTLLLMGILAPAVQRQYPFSLVKFADAISIGNSL